MNKVRLKWTSVVLTLFSFLLPAGDCQNGDFIAGSFILTQKALSEAPYRYSRFLTSALERMEKVDPPSKRDEENCNVRYRIEPSGELLDVVFTQSPKNLGLGPFRVATTGSSPEHPIKTSFEMCVTP